MKKGFLRYCLLMIICMFCISDRVYAEKIINVSNRKDIEKEVGKALSRRDKSVVISSKKYNFWSEDFKGIMLSAYNYDNGKVGSGLAVRVQGVYASGNFHKNNKKVVCKIKFTYEENKKDLNYVKVVTKKSVKKEKRKARGKRLIKNIKKWVTRMGKYDFTYSRYTAKDLLKGSSVCSGYATLLDYSLRTAGFNSKIILGSANGGSHAWVAVGYGGKWYYIDPTFADNKGCFEKYFMFGKKELKKYGFKVSPESVMKGVSETRL